MKNVIVGVLLGIFISTAALIPALLYLMEDKEAFGRNQGFVEGGLEVVYFLDQHFTEEKDRDDQVIDVFHFKDRSVYVIDSSGVKTIKTQ